MNVNADTSGELLCPTWERYSWIGMSRGANSILSRITCRAVVTDKGAFLPAASQEVCDASHKNSFRIARKALSPVSIFLAGNLSSQRRYPYSHISK